MAHVGEEGRLGATGGLGLRLGPLSDDDLGLQRVVGCRELGRPVADARFELVPRRPQLVLDAQTLVNLFREIDCRFANPPLGRNKTTAVTPQVSRQKQGDDRPCSQRGPRLPQEARSAERAGADETQRPEAPRHVDRRFPRQAARRLGRPLVDGLSGSGVGDGDAHTSAGSRLQRRVHKVSDPVDRDRKPAEVPSPRLERRHRSIVDGEEHEKAQLKGRLLNQPDRSRRNSETSVARALQRQPTLSFRLQVEPERRLVSRQVLQIEDGKIFWTFARRYQPPVFLLLDELKRIEAVLVRPGLPLAAGGRWHPGIPRDTLDFTTPAQRVHDELTELATADLLPGVEEGFDGVKRLHRPDQLPVQRFHVLGRHLRHRIAPFTNLPIPDERRGDARDDQADDQHADGRQVPAARQRRIVRPIQNCRFSWHGTRATSIRAAKAASRDEAADKRNVISQFGVGMDSRAPSARRGFLAQKCAVHLAQRRTCRGSRVRRRVIGIFIRPRRKGVGCRQSWHSRRK